MKRLILPLIAATLGAAFSRVALAEPGYEIPNRWAVARLQGLVTIPLGENNVAAWNDCGSGLFHYIDFQSSIDTHTSGGLLASFEYVFKQRYGVEIGLTYWQQIMTLYAEAAGYTVEGFPNFIMPTFAVNYHFLTDGKKDFYGGALCALGVVATGSGAEIDVSKDVALGVTIGMDYFVKGSWSVGGAVKYIDFGEINFSLFPEGMQGILCDNGLFGLGHLNVVSMSAGVGYRF
jgi:outer membrane protein W